MSIYIGLIQKSTCTALNDTRAQSLQSGARGLGGRIMKDPPIEGECVPHFFHSRVSRWTSKPSEHRFPSQIPSVSWCWIILIPCPIKLLIPFVWKCFMKTAFLAAVSCGSQKNYPHIYVLQQYEKIAPRTSWLCCFCGWCFSMVQLGETTEPLFSFPPWDLSTHIQVAFLKHSLAEQKDKEAGESWRCWCKGLYKKWALMTSSNLTLHLS